MQRMPFPAWGIIIALAVVVFWFRPAWTSEQARTAFHSHTRPVTAVASLTMQGVVATGDMAGVFHFWRLAADDTTVGAKLVQDGAGVGLTATDKLPGPITAMAFGDGRCNGPDTQSVSDCVIAVAGDSGSGFSYLRIYDWQRQRLLVDMNHIRGAIHHIAIADGGETLAACMWPDGVLEMTVDYRRGKAFKIGEGTIGEGCTWVGYRGGRVLRYATGRELRQINRAGGGGSGPAQHVLDAGSRTAFAFNPHADGVLDTAVGRQSHIDIFGKILGVKDEAIADTPGRLAGKIALKRRYGGRGAEALAWFRAEGRDFLLAVGPFRGEGASSGVTHQIERWPLPDVRGESRHGKVSWLRGSTFNELARLEGPARRLIPLAAPWQAGGKTTEETPIKYFLIQDASHRFVLMKTQYGYSKTAAGERMADPFFALEPRPFTLNEMRMSAQGDYACLWPRGGGKPHVFTADGAAGRDCRLSRSSPELKPAVHQQGKGQIVIAPATQPLDVPIDQLLAYATTADRRALFLAVSTDNGGSELRRYDLREDRWAIAHAQLNRKARIVALAIQDSGFLGIAMRQAGAAGEYRLETRDLGGGEASLPDLVVHHFQPDQVDRDLYSLCFDTLDPATALALYKDGQAYLTLGSPVSDHTGSDGEAADGAVELVASAPDNGCATSAVPDRMQRFRMQFRLPADLTGSYEVAIAGTRRAPYAVNFSRPKLYVLAIGINDYHDQRWRLNYAVNDARAFTDLVRRSQNQIYQDVDITFMKNGDATRKYILIELAKLQRKATSKDWVFIFFAGHAQADWMYDYYFLSWDYLHAYPHAINISEYDLTQHIRAIPGKKVLVLDTCYAGNLSSSPLALSRGIAGDRAVGSRGSSRLPIRQVRRYAEELMQMDNGLILLAASSVDQTAREESRFGHGVFTSTLLDALRSPERFPRRRYPGALTIGDIRDWIEEEVVRRSRDRQRPVIVAPVDLMRAPFWQVSPATYEGPPRKRGEVNDEPFGRPVWSTDWNSG